MPQGVSPSPKVVEKYVKKQEVPVVPPGILSKLLAMKMGPGNTLTGVYNPFTGSVEADPSSMGSQDYEDVLAHELTHAKQRNEEGLLSTLYSTFTGEGEPYNRRPSELEAYQAEIENRRRQGKSVEYMVRPSWDQPSDTRGLLQRLFTSPDVKMISRGDINLRGR